MNANFSPNWFWANIQTLLVTLLLINLSSCGGGSSSSINKDASSDVDLETTLSDLRIPSVPLEQTFQPSQTNYTASAVSTQEAIVLIAVATNQNATIQVNGNELEQNGDTATIFLVEGKNLISLVVTAADGTNSTTYTITVQRGDPISDASLSDLTLSTT
jgi:hypothetical protein